jgi:hypothetical protein
LYWGYRYLPPRGWTYFAASFCILELLLLCTDCWKIVDRSSESQRDRERVCVVAPRSPSPSLCLNSLSLPLLFPFGLSPSSSLRVCICFSPHNS